MALWIFQKEWWYEWVNILFFISVLMMVIIPQYIYPSGEIQFIGFVLAIVWITIKVYKWIKKK